MSRGDWKIVSGNAASPFSGGFRWRETNSENDAITNNRTVIEVQMWASVSASRTSYDHAAKSSYYRATINGAAQTVNLKSMTDWGGKSANTSYYAGSAYPLKVTSGSSSASFTVNHNADGSAPSVTIKTVWAADAGSFQGVTTEESISIPSISRATTPSLNYTSRACGESVTISLTPSNAGFTHTLTYSCGSASGEIAGNTSSTSINWTVPSSLASQFGTSGANKPCTITCKTYLAGSLIGTKQVGLTVTLPNSYAPSVSIGTITKVSGGSTGSQILQGVDALSIPITVTLKSGAGSVASVKVNIDGRDYYAASPSTSVTIATDAISGSGSVLLTVTATDNRGMSGSASENVSVTAYQRPQIARFSVNRTDDSSNNAAVRFAAVADSACTLTIQTRSRGSGSYTTVGTISQNTPFDGQYYVGYTATITLARTGSWVVRAELAEAAYGVTTAWEIPLAAVLTYSEKAGGRAAAFFQSAAELTDGVLKVNGTLDANAYICGGSSLVSAEYGAFSAALCDEYENTAVLFSNNCFFYKIGRMVYFNVAINVTSIAGMSGEIGIIGLPYKPNTVTPASVWGSGSLVSGGSLSAANVVSIFAGSDWGSGAVSLYAVNSSGAQSALNTSMIGTLGMIRVSGCYLTT